MTLFDKPVNSTLLWPINAPWPKRRARAQIKRFQACFPHLIYDMDLAVELANAQAFLAGKQRHVRLYGGLVRHRLVGAAGLAFALAHETGHHVGGAPFMKYQPWISSEERATDWAVSEGLQEVFGPNAARRIVHRGPLQLRAIGIVE